MAETPWQITAGAVTVRRLASTQIAMLRLRGFDAAVLDAVGAALHTTLPVRPGTSLGTAPRTLCLAPGEWMIVDHGGTLGTFSVAATGAEVAHCAAVSDGMRSYAVSGTASHDLLAKACTLDLHESVFTPGQCAQSLLAQVDVVIERPPGGDDIIVHAPASYAHHLETWFTDATIEFRPEVTA